MIDISEIRELTEDEIEVYLRLFQGKNNQIRHKFKIKALLKTMHLKMSYFEAKMTYKSMYDRKEFSKRYLNLLLRILNENRVKIITS